MKGIKVTPPKKATTPSLSDLLDKTEPEATKSDDEVRTAGVDGVMVEPAGSEVVEQEKPVEENPDGVAFSGTGNVIDKTPAELSAETPEQTANRFNISDEIPEDIANNPNVQVYADDKNFQIPGGTHVHPDIAKDNYNRAVGSPSSNVGTTRVVSENVYATEAEQDDKGLKRDVPEEENYYAEESDEDDKFKEVK